MTTTAKHNKSTKIPNDLRQLNSYQRLVEQRRLAEQPAPRKHQPEPELPPTDDLSMDFDNLAKPALEPTLAERQHTERIAQAEARLVKAKKVKPAPPARIPAIPRPTEFVIYSIEYNDNPHIESKRENLDLIPAENADRALRIYRAKMVDNPKLRKKLTPQRVIRAEQHPKPRKVRVSRKAKTT